MSFQRSLLLALFIASVAMCRTVVNLDQETGTMLDKRSVVPLMNNPPWRFANINEGHNHDKYSSQGKGPKIIKKGPKPDKGSGKEKEKAIAGQPKRESLGEKKLDEAAAAQQQNRKKSGSHGPPK
ncbi:hypothetical protein PGT21_050355 [Puccinia graminis f. sp. tritici]|uniref:Secreted protein n=1 Tax=Puccinia graminis f. sp. tritici TaxID=56615 RepID=A0A5B0RS82_PUCGR|nr:hypothetical protein PGT21_050355 [Puccinia graminis f. sp. tritici]KAA1128199.1 hypothetical protein PGTUg99_004516 [Puccinia graminis f. sp. tritici]